MGLEPWRRNRLCKKTQYPCPYWQASPYSIDQNLWGRSNECGVLEDPYVAPPQDAYDLTSELEDTPDTADEILITFDQGIPTHINGEYYALDDLILYLNERAGKHGIGRIDHIENRLVGIKSREVYETPGAEVIIKAHQALETITLTKDVAHFKPIIEKQFAEQVYNGLWFSPLTDALKTFVDHTQNM